MLLLFFEDFLFIRFSTSFGIMTDRKARLRKLGGEVLFYIWFHLNSFIFFVVFWFLFSFYESTQFSEKDL